MSNPISNSGKGDEALALCGTALLDRTLVSDAVVVVRGGRIIQAGRAGDMPTIFSKAKRIELSGHIIAPGFIDIHVHGSGGCRAEDDAPGMARHVIRSGTTCFLPTFISNEFEKMLEAIDHVCSCAGPVVGGATIGGIHLEGPFLNPRYGAQRSETNIEPNSQLVRQLIERCGKYLCMVTIAPERNGAIEAIAQFRAAGATVSIGHSNATESQYLAGRLAGVTHATHLYNAMPPPAWPTAQTYDGTQTVGVVELVLADEQVTADIMCDATCDHVHPSLLHVAMQCKPLGHLSLISDAMVAAGLPVGEFVMADGQRIFTHEGEDVVRLANGALCGSAISLCGAISNLIKHTGVPLETALVMTSEAPARAIGIFDRKGSIKAGKDADLTILDDELNVCSVMVGGHFEYSQQEGAV